MKLLPLNWRQGSNNSIFHLKGTSKNNIRISPSCSWDAIVLSEKSKLESEPISQFFWKLKRFSKSQSCSLGYHGIVDYPELEETHKDHWSPSLGPAQHHPQESQHVPESIIHYFS